MFDYIEKELDTNKECDEAVRQDFIKNFRDAAFKIYDRDAAFKIYDLDVKDIDFMLDMTCDTEGLSRAELFLNKIYDYHTKISKDIHFEVNRPSSSDLLRFIQSSDYTLFMSRVSEAHFLKEGCAAFLADQSVNTKRFYNICIYILKSLQATKRYDLI